MDTSRLFSYRLFFKKLQLVIERGKRIFFPLNPQKLPDHTHLFQKLHTLVDQLKGSFIPYFMNGMDYLLGYMDGVIDGNQWSMDQFNYTLNLEKNRIVEQENKTRDLSSEMHQFRGVVDAQIASFNGNDINPSSVIRETARVNMQESNKWRDFRTKVCWGEGGDYYPHPMYEFVPIKQDELNRLTTENQAAWVSATANMLAVVLSNLEGIRTSLAEASIRSIQEAAISSGDKFLLEKRIKATRAQCESLKNIMEPYLTDYLQDMIMRGCW